ncbi:MAG: hypothetical protein ACKOU7_04575 [Ferruginibacter sp.]
MNLHLLHTISGILILLCLVCKTSLHYYLDNKHNRHTGFIYTLVNPLPYLRLYRTAVTEKFMQLKRLCNLLLVLSFISLLLNLMLGLLIFMN